MTYHGAVKVGGPPDVRELAHLIITKVAVGPYDNNAYLLRCRATDEQLLIDAAADAPVLLETVGDQLATVVTTHRHHDHWGALAEVVATTGARTAAGEHDAEGVEVPTELLLADGDVLRVGQVGLTVRHLVGHTPGAIVLVYDDPQGHPHVFTGDCLFPGGVGNTWGDPEAFRTLFRDVNEKIFDALPDEAWVYPGHGNDTTLGAERPHLAEWRERGW
ncbi:MBL fold metallo-hydrolase [Kitasatospora sp. NPDC101176]|uniref:MBL fold metallo-hydrolase n=1 Tax=Kitasatospora sp. NPDC101176 TaxID=3364099 RepID=UPI00381EFC4A